MAGGSGHTYVDEAGRPRRAPGLFWNAGSTEGRLLEIISPAGFERYSRDPPELPERLRRLIELLRQE